MLQLRVYGRPEALAAPGHELEHDGTAQHLALTIAAACVVNPLAVLAVNIVMILLGGAATLVTQRRFARRR